MKTKSRKARDSFDFKAVSLCTGQEWIVSAPDVLACIDALLLARTVLHKIPEKKRSDQERFLLSEFDRLLEKEADWMKKLEEVNMI